MVTFYTLFLILQAALSGKSKVGINLDGISYYSAGLKFLNRFQGASAFRDAEGNSSLDLDSNGYVKSLAPGQAVGAYFMALGLGDDGIWHVPESMQVEHVFLYEGDCSGCSFRWNCVVLNDSVDGMFIVPRNMYMISHSVHCKKGDGSWM